MCKEQIVTRSISGVSVLLGLIGLLWWFSGSPTAGLQTREPGMDDPHGRRARLLENLARIAIGEHFVSYDGIPGDITGQWPRFRGPNMDNVVNDGVKLAENWDKAGPKVLWSIELGEGHAGAAVANGRVYVLDYLEEKKRDALRCFSLSDGKEIWRRSYNVHVKRNHGMSRTIPTVTDKVVVTIGPMCHVMCVRTDSGDLLWGKDLVRDYGTKIPGWYAGQCPLIEDGLTLLAPAGTNVLMTALENETGKTVWETPNPNQWNMSHSSITPMTLNGRRMYVYVAVGGLAGVAADGEERGRILWKVSSWSPPVAVPSPVILDNGRIFLTAGYGAGSMMLQITEEAGTYAAHVLFKRTPKNWLACEQQTPILYEGHLFGIMPKDAGKLRKQFVCYDPDGELVWSSGKAARFGIGPFFAADGKLFILNDDGVLTVARASTLGYEPLHQVRVLDGRDSWAPPALAAGRLLIRDSRRMVCLDIREK